MAFQCCWRIRQKIRQYIYSQDFVDIAGNRDIRVHDLDDIKTLIQAWLESNRNTRAIRCRLMLTAIVNSIDD